MLDGFVVTRLHGVTGITAAAGLRVLRVASTFFLEIRVHLARLGWLRPFEVIQGGLPGIAGDGGDLLPSSMGHARCPRARRTVEWAPPRAERVLSIQEMPGGRSRIVFRSRVTRSKGAGSPTR